MDAKEFYDKKALKIQLKTAIKYDHSYFKDSIIAIMEDYAKKKVEENKEEIREWLRGEDFEGLSERI